MKNKYFTPENSDLCIGYELEYKSYEQGNYKPLTIFDGGSIDDIIKDAISQNYVRVPYLTKEQIEAEGWTYNKETSESYEWESFYKNNYMLGWWPLENKIALLIKDPSLVKDYYQEPSYRGLCKDINTFIKIVKLLGI